MGEAAIVVGLMGAMIAVIWLRPVVRQWQRSRWQQRPFPPLWEAVVSDTFPAYDRLSPSQRRRLQGQIQVFLAEKQFIGCGGLQVTVEMQVTIAAIACVLLLAEPGREFTNLRSILLYPTAYRVKATTAIDRFVVTEQQETRLGESWTADQVVLAWDAIAWDRQHWQDGHNLVLHEFAHQLDQADGRADGVPILRRRTDYDTWATVMTPVYQQLCAAVQQGRKPVLNPYGATNPAEFFAVATETFFEQPRSLQRHHPTLYDQLRQYYQLDPLTWLQEEHEDN